MARRPPVPPLPPLPAPLRQRREERSRRVLATRAVRDRVVSLAGSIGAPLLNQSGDEIGTIADFVAKWDGLESYPPVTGMVVRVGRRRTWVPGKKVADLTEDLERPARQALLASLEPETAADAMEEMDPEELESLIRETPAEQAAALVAEMEPDEAADALRDLGSEEREELLELMDDVQR